jgi:hypothetical protein
MPKQHNIVSARWEESGKTDPDSAVTVVMADGRVSSRRANDDIRGGGMLAFLAEGGVIGPYVEPAPTKDELMAHAAEIRWQRETGGITVNGIPVPTDDRAKLLIKGAADDMADADTANYISGSTSVPLTGAQFKALNSAVIAHVAACFAVQAAVMADIEAGTITTKAEIESAAWPS